MKHIPNSIKDRYEILGVIGEGAYGVVLKARKKVRSRQPFVEQNPSTFGCRIPTQLWRSNTSNKFQVSSHPPLSSCCHSHFSSGHTTDMDIIDRELSILQSLRFENVVELIEWFREKRQCLLVFEYVEWVSSLPLAGSKAGFVPFLTRTCCKSYRIIRGVYRWSKSGNYPINCSERSIGVTRTKSFIGTSSPRICSSRNSSP